MDNFIKFTDADADGYGTDAFIFVKAEGPKLNSDAVDRVETAIANYKNSEEEWQMDGCIEAAKLQLESEGYSVTVVEPVDIYV
ncbi:MAG: hypothetical protein NC393_04115 [Clostridium sp.]|nr:hypothetical protein [Clostridium sp.]MCM1208966.1 hypothetical protein [Ruminococcus sp.]